MSYNFDILSNYHIMEQSAFSSAMSFPPGRKELDVCTRAN